MEQLALFETETPDAASGVCLDPGAPYRAPAALTDQECEIREIRPQAASELVRAWHSILPHIPPRPTFGATGTRSVSHWSQTVGRMPSLSTPRRCLAP